MTNGQPAFHLSSERLFIFPNSWGMQPGSIYRDNIKSKSKIRLALGPNKFNFQEQVSHPLLFKTFYSVFEEKRIYNTV
jgi:hypothetical protein